METKVDVIIIGGGPAGLTAGIYIARAKQKCVIIDEGSVGGQMIMSHSVANYPGVEETSGYALATIMKKQAKSFGCEIVANCDITAMDITSTLKKIVVDNEDSYLAPAVIIASGGRPRELGIASEEKFKGLGISYCATCDGDFFRDKEIVVVGGGNTALEEAVSLTKYVSKITLVHQFDHFQAYEHAIEEIKKNDKIEIILESEISDFFGDETLNSVAIKNNKSGEVKTVNVQGAFIFIGYVPNTDRFKNDLALSQYGEIVCDENMASSLSGVFAAGDVRQKKVRQISTAVADGTIAALSSIEYLNNQR